MKHLIILGNQDYLQKMFFFKYGPIPASFSFIFVLFHITNQLQIEKSVDGVLGIRTRGRRTVGADETTELWRPPKPPKYVYIRQVAKMFLQNGASHSGKFIQNLNKIIQLYISNFNNN